MNKIRKVHKRQYNFDWNEYQNYYYASIGNGMRMLVENNKDLYRPVKERDDNIYYAYLGYFQTRSLKAFTKHWRSDTIGRYPTLEGAKMACEIEMARRIKSAYNQLNEIKIKD
jgi:hypothetical protein